MRCTSLTRLQARTRLPLNLDPITDDERALLNLDAVTMPPEQRHQAAQQLLGKVVTVLALSIGEEETLQLLHDVAKAGNDKKSRRRRQRDVALLRIYDRRCQDSVAASTIPHWIAITLNALYPGAFGPGEEAIEKHVRAC